MPRVVGEEVQLGFGICENGFSALVATHPWRTARDGGEDVERVHRPQDVPRTVPTTTAKLASNVVVSFQTRHTYSYEREGEQKGAFTMHERPRYKF